MELELNINGNALIARPDCEIDHYSAGQLRVQVDAAFEKSVCKHIVFDFSQVSFMDSSGIGMIIGRYKSAEKRGGKLALANMSDDIARIYQISGLAKIITKAASVDEAVQQLGMGREVI